MWRKLLSIVLTVALIACGAQVRAIGLESWENPTDPTFGGWTIPTSENANFSASYDTTFGITNGLQSVKIALSNPNLLNPGATATVIDPGDPTAEPPIPPTYKRVYQGGAVLPNGTVAAGPTYGQMLRSPSLISNTSLLGRAGVIAIDINVPNTGPDFGIGAFDYFLQVSAAVNNANTMYRSLDNFSYSQSANIGGQKTLYFAVPNSVAATLAASTSPTELIFQVGGGYQANYNADGTLHQVSSQILYVDSVRVLPKGDFTLDGELTNLDIQAMINALEDPSFASLNRLTSDNINQNNPYLGLGDFNGDNLVDSQDITGLLRTLVGRPVDGGSPAAVPEPGAAVLWGIGSVVSLFLVSRRKARSDVN